jgi:hypothetical protein
MIVNSNTNQNTTSYKGPSWPWSKIEIQIKIHLLFTIMAKTATCNWLYFDWYYYLRSWPRLPLVTGYFVFYSKLLNIIRSIITNLTEKFFLKWKKNNHMVIHLQSNLYWEVTFGREKKWPYKTGDLLKQVQFRCSVWDCKGKSTDRNHESRA